MYTSPSCLFPMNDDSNATAYQSNHEFLYFEIEPYHISIPTQLVLRSFAFEVRHLFFFDKLLQETGSQSTSVNKHGGCGLRLQGSDTRG